MSRFRRTTALLGVAVSLIVALVSASAQTPTSPPPPTSTVIIGKRAVSVNQTVISGGATQMSPAGVVTMPGQLPGGVVAGPTPARVAERVREGELPSDVFAPLSPEAAAAKAAAEAKKQQQLQKVQQLTFDRRPSAMLKAWSTPREVALKEGTNATSPDSSIPPGMSAATIRRLQAAGTPVPSPVSEAPTTSPAAAPGVTDTFDRDLKALQLDVTLGDWPAVKADFQKLEAEIGKAAYGQMLQSLSSGVNNSSMMQGQIQFMNGVQVAMPPPQQFTMEKNVFSNEDVLALARVSPVRLEKDRISPIGQILRQAIEQGNAVEDFVARAREEVKKPEKDAALTERQVALVLFAAGNPLEAGVFLPSFDKAVASNDREALNLLARHYLALNARDKKAQHLEQAWNATQAALAAGTVDREQKDEAVRRAVELTPKIRDELGRTWLESSFSERPERGMEIIAAIGSASSQGLQTHGFDTDFRLKSLELQKLAVDTLLAKSPDRAKAWRSSLALLAESWLKEADFSRRFDLTRSLGPRMQYDSFGNVYYSNMMNEMSPEMMMQRQGNMPKALTTGDVLKNRPGDAWLGSLDDGIRPKFATVLAQLYLKVDEEETAFPFIERLATTNPRQAKELAEEFVRTWTKNHDPNSQQLQRSRFFYVYGFESRAEGIPLTRSKQERNLVELADWIKRLRKLPIGDLDESLLTKAFTACHSPAEVYRLDAINRVFGSFDALKPATLASLIQQMRANLVSVWRQPEQQQQQKTKRKEKDIRAEVLRGYEVARSVVDQGLAKHPDHWALVLAKAALLHDENNYRQELEHSPEYAPRRQEAMAVFKKAADLYLAAAPRLPQDEQSTQPFDVWFLAALGACDVGAITDESLPDPKQPPLIKQSLASLKGEEGERHLSKFANTLFTQLNNVKPSVKVRYLKYGLEIVGDHPQAHEAQKVYEYYRDLVTEIKLVSQIDGPDTVGHGKPFGVFVNLLHTKEIERESGGFGRYLQNQNSGGLTYYNYGRPLVNYRDKFQEVVKQALNDQFEIVSVTFQDEKVNSRATNDYGWRVTPYAYLLLKARGPKVDKLAPLRLDLDFMDTSGYVILPVESPPLPLDASTDAPPARPFTHVELTQTLDERQAEDGKLIVEVKATAHGLVPEIDNLLDLKAEGFKLADVEDQGLAVSRFDPDSPENVVDSERTWLVKYQGAVDQGERASSFRFPTSKVDGASLVHQRYVDADLAKVEPVVALESRYGEAGRTWLWWLLGGLVAGLVALAGLAAYLRSLPRNVKEARFTLPDPITPFSVLGLLRDIQRHNGLPAPQFSELGQSISQLERHYFSDKNGEAEPDLRKIAETWVTRSS